ncbi:hypothetical protein CBR_g23019 [Chara braunii]|uniref:histidine kinase n=1 Tax=Chara braunii TaxID=69332 RepID=A0A388L3C0_CHABU|nr:hypothetical protein CBR_g23019 [Chara braunii]|eukprot:GBG76804.1 hypothetical protein CBR_g23019 [Chara braunii]
MDVRFFAMAKTKVGRTTIEALEDPNLHRGPLFTSTAECTKIARDFYQNLFKSECGDRPLAQRLGEIEEFLSPLSRTLTEHQREQLEMPLTKEEVWTTLMLMDEEKTPGIDGLPKELWESMWGTISQDLMDYYHTLWETGQMGEFVGQGVLTLLYKKGAMELKEQLFSPVEIVKHIMQMAIAATREKGISVESSVEEGVPTQVLGDALRIRQVMKYLVLNAIKFTEAGRVSIHLGVADKEPERVRRQGVSTPHANTRKREDVRDPSHCVSSALDLRGDGIENSGEPGDHPPATMKPSQAACTSSGESSGRLRASGNGADDSEGAVSSSAISASEPDVCRRTARGGDGIDSDESGDCSPGTSTKPSQGGCTSWRGSSGRLRAGENGTSEGAVSSSAIFASEADLWRRTARGNADTAKGSSKWGSTSLLRMGMDSSKGKGSSSEEGRGGGGGGGGGSGEVGWFTQRGLPKNFVTVDNAVKKQWFLVAGDKRREQSSSFGSQATCGEGGGLCANRAPEGAETFPPAPRRIARTLSAAASPRTCFLEGYGVGYYAGSSPKALRPSSNVSDILKASLSHSMPARASSPCAGSVTGDPGSNTTADGFGPHSGKGEGPPGGKSGWTAERGCVQLELGEGLKKLERRRSWAGFHCGAELDAWVKRGGERKRAVRKCNASAQQVDRSGDGSTEEGRAASTIAKLRGDNDASPASEPGVCSSTDANIATGEVKSTDKRMECHHWGRSGSSSSSGSAGATKGGDLWLWCDIVDTGVGIPEEVVFVQPGSSVVVLGSWFTF